MKQEEIKQYLNEYFENLDLTINYKDFNLYEIKIYPEGFEVSIDYKYDNHLTTVGNIYKIIEEISLKIINYYKGFKNE